MCNIDDGQKKCSERCGKTQKSQQSLGSVSKDLTVVKSVDTVQSTTVAAADVADVADVMASDLAVIDSDITALEEPEQQQESMIGLLLAVCCYFLYEVHFCTKSILSDNTHIHPPSFNGLLLQDSPCSLYQKDKPFWIF